MHGCSLQNAGGVQRPLSPYPSPALPLPDQLLVSEWSIEFGTRVVRIRGQCPFAKGASSCGEVRCERGGIDKGTGEGT